MSSISISLFHHLLSPSHNPKRVNNTITIPPVFFSHTQKHGLLYENGTHHLCFKTKNSLSLSLSILSIT